MGGGQFPKKVLHSKNGLTKSWGTHRASAFYYVDSEKNIPAQAIIRFQKLPSTSFPPLPSEKYFCVLHLSRAITFDR